MAEIKINAVGDKCPIPVVKTKKALKEITEKSVVTVTVDNDIAVQNVTRLATNNNLAVTSDRLPDGNFEIVI
ncbi:MAG: sulfurtransferase TusA family protein, partial [Clostridia bacterium]|nr:sulfurtransferase TusA family protein [Clostridia bacterium]